MLFESGDSQKRIIQEVMHDYAPKHNLKKQTELHRKKFVMMKTMMIGIMEQNQPMGSR